MMHYLTLTIQALVSHCLISLQTLNYQLKLSRSQSNITSKWTFQTIPRSNVLGSTSTGQSLEQRRRTSPQHENWNTHPRMCPLAQKQRPRALRVVNTCTNQNRRHINLQTEVFVYQTTEIIVAIVVCCTQTIIISMTNMLMLIPYFIPYNK